MRSEDATLLQGEALVLLRTVPAESAQCCVTSPPYWSLRDYGVAGQIGLECTPEEYVARLVEVFREVRRVLAPDGTLWLVIGDSYTSGNRTNRDPGRSTMHEPLKAFLDGGRPQTPDGLKPKDLVGIPWRVAFALQADGWYLRSDIIWSKPNPMPESVTDRPTRAHESLFLLSTSEQYYYDAKAIAENRPANQIRRRRADVVGGANSHGVRHSQGSVYTGDKQRGHSRRHAGFNDRWNLMSQEQQDALGRNKRTVWTIATQPYAGAHFAVMPEALVEPCVMAGSRPGDLVLDPFAGSGTVGVVALRAGRRFLGIDISAAYLDLARERLRPLLSQERLPL